MGCAQNGVVFRDTKVEDLQVREEFFRLRNVICNYDESHASVLPAHKLHCTAPVGQGEEHAFDALILPAAEVDDADVIRGVVLTAVLLLDL